VVIFRPRPPRTSDERGGRSWTTRRTCCPRCGWASWAKTLSGVLAAVGLSLAGLTGTLKNSAPALLKRLRQDAYTDLVAVAVQTAPPPPNRSALQRAISHRTLTPATPN